MNAIEVIRMMEEIIIRSRFQLKTIYLLAFKKIACHLVIILRQFEDITIDP